MTPTSRSGEDAARFAQEGPSEARRWRAAGVRRLFVHSLTERLRSLAGEERIVQADFLLHLDALDRRRGYAELGYPSLWEYCLRALHLREGEVSRLAAARNEAAEPTSFAVTSDSVDSTDAGNLADEAVPPAQELRHEEQPRRASPAEVRAVAEAQWSLRVTLDGEARRDLETLMNLLAHKIPDGNLAAVLKEALRCAIEKHAVRRGMLAPARKKSALSKGMDSAPAQAVLAAPSCSSRHDERDRSEIRDRGRPSTTDGGEPPAPVSSARGARSANRPAIPAEVRRQVWARDGGTCTFVARDGTRCESRWKLELDHVTPWALGGSSTIDDLRLRCRAHNVLHAEEVFGREHMDRFRRCVSGSSFTISEAPAAHERAGM